MRASFTFRSFVMLITMVALSFSSLSAATPAFSMSVPSAANATTAEVSSAATMTKKEKKTAKKALKQKLKDLKANLKSGNLTDTDTLLLVIIGILLPPLAVFLYEGSITNRFWISLLLTLLFWLPGAIYSILVVTGSI